MPHFPHAQLVQLKDFVALLKKKPELLKDDELLFFREYLAEMGANIPDIMVDEEEEVPSSSRKEEQKGPQVTKDDDVEFEEEPEEEEGVEEEEKEEVDPDVIPPEQDPPQPMGTEFEVTDELRERSSELRQQANELVANGDLAGAVEKLTEAITKCNPSSAPLHAARGQLYLKLKKPLSAIRDGEAAIRINPDSATGYRVRGKGKALIGEWENAVVDLRSANQRDYDPDINDVLKTVSAKAQVVIDKRKKREEKQKTRRAKGGAKPQPGAAGGFDFSNLFGSFASNPVVGELLKDPAFMEAMSDPESIAILSEIASDPTKISKYQDHPKFKPLIEKYFNK